MADFLSVDGKLIPGQLTIGGGVEREIPRPPSRWPSRRAALRWLLSDHQWHPWRECAKWGGARFGARLLELRRCAGLQWEKRKGPHAEWEYRAVPPAELARRAEQIAEQAMLGEAVRHGA